MWRDGVGLFITRKRSAAAFPLFIDIEIQTRTVTVDRRQRVPLRGRRFARVYAPPVALFITQPPLPISQAGANGASGLDPGMIGGDQLLAAGDVFEGDQFELAPAYCKHPAVFPGIQ
jgi:hypothetical protein